VPVTSISIASVSGGQLNDTDLSGGPGGSLAVSGTYSGNGNLSARPVQIFASKDGGTTFTQVGSGNIPAVNSPNGVGWSATINNTAFLDNFSGNIVFQARTPTATGGTGTTTNSSNLNVATETVCFYPGTLIRTPAGEMPVEALRAGDLVLTAAGETAPVRWMGRQTVSTRFGDALRVLPIRITAGALGEELPRRDLLVSPDHALLVDGVLVQAGALVNGTTIRREARVPEVFTYWHVELADHALVLAEGVPAETFIDNVARLAFDNWDEHEAAGSEAPIVEMALPRAKSARQVPVAIRKRLEERAALLLGEQTAAA